MSTITMQHPEAAKVKAIKFNGYKIDLSTNLKGKPVARLYKLLTAGKNKGEYKLIQGYYFGTDERRIEWVKEQMNNIKNRIEDKLKTSAAKKDAISLHTFKAGDCLYQSWGYEQTNIDFFEIIEVLPKSVKIRPISQIVVSEGGFMCENVKPNKGDYTGEVVTRPIKAWFWNKGDEKPNFSVSNGRHSLSLYTYGDKGVYQSHYA